MKPRTIGYGELLLRLTPHDHGDLLEQSDLLKMGFAGAEANILGDLGLLGHDVGFVSAFPKNPIGRRADQFLRSLKVDTNAIIWDEGRLGTYYIEHGTSIRGTRVTYDRAHSSVSRVLISSASWEDIFKHADYFVLTGITPALSDTCRTNVRNALEIAKAHKIKIFFDLNFRRTLWKAIDARRSFESILPFVDVLFANIGSAHDVFDFQIENFEGFDGLKSVTKKAADVLNKLGNFEMIAMTLRLQKSAHQNELGGMIRKDDQYFFSDSIHIDVVDRLGGGDAFAAAIIHGISKRWSTKETINFASAAFAAAQTIKGDINYVTEQELLEIATGNVKGYVRR